MTVRANRDANETPNGVGNRAPNDGVPFLAGVGVARYPSTNASLGTNPNPPTSDNGVTSTFGERARRVAFALYRDGRTGDYQLTVEDETGSGHRLAGPKFDGTGCELQRHWLDEHDAAAIRGYLDAAFPSTAASVDEGSSRVVSTGDQQ